MCRLCLPLSVAPAQAFPREDRHANSFLKKELAVGLFVLLECAYQRPRVFTLKNNDNNKDNTLALLCVSEPLL